MGFLQQIEEAGFTAELGEQFNLFFQKDNAGQKKQLMDLIDKHGLQNGNVLKQVGAFQRDEVLKPGLYRIFKKIADEMKGGNGAAEPTEEADPETTEEPKKEAVSAEKPAAKSAPKQEAISKGEGVAEAAVEAPKQKPAPKIESVDTGMAKLPDSEEKKIADRMKKEREKMEADLAKRQAAKEKALRDSAMKRLQRKSERLGLKTEEAQKINELKDKISQLMDKRKQINDLIAKYRDEVATIRPRRVTKRAKVAPEGANKIKAKIRNFLKQNPGSDSKAIVEAIEVERKVYNSIISEMREANEVVKSGRGPYTVYTLA